MVQVIVPDIEAIKADEFFDENTVLVGEEEARIVITPEAVTVCYTSLASGYHASELNSLPNRV